ncbi:MAG: (E)-4-hydroxy-3-methylbut-2-enyl-diphosphate synthase [Verrucomicrobiota bacterium]
MISRRDSLASRLLRRIIGREMHDSARNAGLQFCPSLYSFTKRRSREVKVGDVGLGGDNPIRVQSMITSDTLDTEASIAQAVGLAEAGCEIVRITAQTKKHAANLQNIIAGVRAAGWDTPIVADIHFKPNAAMEAAKWVQKVRVNPGNYADNKKFAVREYTEAEYAEEIERIREEFSPLVELCKDRGVAMRIGTNHGSLSDRIMNRYGDTPLGMVESALEFARIARDLGYHQFVFSMKASNPKVMIEAYRLLVARLDSEGPDWNYPLHLGVTEAGDGEDGRIKSAIGIGSLLADGIGDTVRVSLTEDAIYEVPVARALVDSVVAGSGKVVAASSCTEGDKPEEYAALKPPFDPFEFHRRESKMVEIDGVTLGAGETVRVFTTREKRDLLGDKMERLGDFQPEFIYEEQLESGNILEIDPRDNEAVSAVNALSKPQLTTIKDGVDMPVIAAFRLLAARIHERHPVLLKDELGEVVAASSCTEPRPTASRTLNEFIRKDFKALSSYTDVSSRQAQFLPHWEFPGATYAVTFRLHDSLPASALQEYAEEREKLEKELASVDGTDSPENAARRRDAAFLKLRLRTIEAALDEGSGACWMKDESVAQIVENSLKYFDGERYDLLAWCVMPNHVHVVFRPLGEHTLAEITHSWKSFSANAANKELDRKGEFWQRESYDHIVREEDDLMAQIEYVLANPANGGLRDWQWIGQKFSDETSTDSVQLEAATTSLRAMLTAGTNIGSLLCDGIGDAVLVRGEESPGRSLRVAFNTLQAAGVRIFKTDFVACPSCGRTLFDLQETTARVRAATGHLKGVRIAIMGCIVNGPGEMADADFGYVGGAPGKINLYVGKEPVKSNIPQAEAVDRLVDLIREHGKWVDVPEPAEAPQLETAGVD